MLAVPTELRTHALRVRHRLIVPGTASRVLADAGRLPQLVTDDRHTAEVDYINAGVAQRYGLRTIVLRSLEHGEPIDGVVDRVHELELFGAVPPSNVLRWQPAETLIDPADRAATGFWSAGRDAPVADGREWTQRGWFAEACAWIEKSLRGAGFAAPFEIVQLRTWATSSVLLAHNQRGDSYFKALPTSGGVEAAIVRFLSQHFADVVPRIIAADADRGWLLMAACRGRKLEDIADVAVWERAAARYARLQVDCIGRVDALRALGCPSRDLAQLARSIEALAADATVRPHPNGLTQAEYDRFIGAVPELVRRCDELAACGIPYSLEHGDLWPGNIFCDATSCAVIDWEDVVVAHPFFSLAPLTVGMLNAGLASAENVARVERAYASAFEALAPASRLRRAIELAVPLCFFDMAARYRRQHPSVVRLHPWMRDLVPQTVRMALAKLS